MWDEGKGLEKARKPVTEITPCKEKLIKPRQVQYAGSQTAHLQMFTPATSRSYTIFSPREREEMGSGEQ